MEGKPIAERTNWPIIAGFIVWVLAIFAMGFSNSAYFALSAAAFALFLCQLALNVRLQRAKA
ncbi:MAG: hypothetical protein M3R04_02760 [bacterium]|nr:hypothetical protein [bacterium]